MGVTAPIPETIMADMKPIDWFGEFESALDFRRSYGMDTAWGTIERYFYTADRRMTVGPNIIASNGDALVSQIMSVNPYITVAPRYQEQVAFSPVLESVDNSLMDRMDVPTECNQAALHAYLWGKGIVKIGYDSEMGYAPELDISQGMTATFTQFDSKGRRIEFGTAQPGMPWISAVLPHDILVPYGTTSCIEYARWVAHRVIRHIDEVKADKKYVNTRNLQPNITMSGFVRSYTTSYERGRLGRMGAGPGIASDTQMGEWVELWEIHDRRTGRIQVVATNYDKYLRDEVDVMQMDGMLPFVDLTFNLKARNFWVTPDAFQLLGHQAQLTDIAWQSQAQRRWSTLKIVIPQDAMDDDEIAKLASDRVGSIIRTKAGIPARDAAAAVSFQTNPMLYEESELIRSDAREVVGFSRNQLGDYAPKTHISASQTVAVQQGAATLSTRRQLALANFYRRIFSKVNEVIFEFWRSPQVTQIIGSTGAMQWQQYTAAAMKGAYDYKVMFSSEPLMTASARFNQAMSIMGQLMNDPMANQQSMREFLVAAANDPRFSQLYQGGQSNAAVSQGVQQPQLPGGGGRPSAYQQAQQEGSVP